MKKLLFAVVAIALVVFAMTTVSQAAVSSRATGKWSGVSTWVRTLTGTSITFTKNSTTVTGTGGTLFTSELAVGDSIGISTSSGTIRGKIASITNDSVLVMTAKPAPNSTVTGKGAALGTAARPTSVATVTISNTTTVTDDYASVTIGSLILASGGTLVDGGNSITLGAGNWTNNGGTYTATGTATFTGASGQSINGTATSQTFNNLTYNSAGQTLSISGSTTTVNVNGAATVTAGTISTGSATLALGGTATISESSGNEVVGTVTVTHTLSMGSNDTFGGIGIEINAADAAPGVTLVTRTTGTALTYNGNSSITRYFVVNPAVNSGLAASVIFHYFQSELNGNTAGSLDVDQTLNGGTDWTLAGGIDNGLTSGAGTIGTPATIDNFGELTAINASAPLAIQLGGFSATSFGQSVTIDWSTVSETNNYGFYVQRGLTQAGPFTTVSGFIQGNGTSLQQHSYSYTQENVAAGTYYYRLKQENMNGTSAFTPAIKFVVSGVEGVKTKTAKPLVFKLNQNFPNPFNPTTQISFEIPENATVSLKIYNALGQLVSTLANSEHVAAGDYTKTFDANSFASGMYFYRLTVAGTHNYESLGKMMLVK